MAGVEGPVCVTDCPRCGYLCYRASILPCGHTVCRRCLSFLLEVEGKKARCPFCPTPIRQHSWQSRQILLQQAVPDHAINQLVSHVLASKADLVCWDHPSTPATHLCLDCDRGYCGRCSGVHRRAQTTARHVQLPLREAPVQGPGLCFGNSPSSVATRNTDIDDATLREEENARNQARDCLQEEVRLLRETSTQLHLSLTHIHSVIHQLQQTTVHLERKQEKLNIYVTHLPHQEAPDVHRIQSVLARVRRVRRDCQGLDDVMISALTQSMDNIHNALSPHAELDPPSVEPVTASSPTADPSMSTATSSWLQGRAVLQRLGTFWGLPTTVSEQTRDNQGSPTQHSKASVGPLSDRRSDQETSTAQSPEMFSNKLSRVNMSSARLYSHTSAPSTSDCKANHKPSTGRHKTGEPSIALRDQEMALVKLQADKKCSYRPQVDNMQKNVQHNEFSSKQRPQPGEMTSIPTPVSQPRLQDVFGTTAHETTPSSEQQQPTAISDQCPGSETVMNSSNAESFRKTPVSNKYNIKQKVALTAYETQDVQCSRSARPASDVVLPETQSETYCPTVLSKRTAYWKRGRPRNLRVRHLDRRRMSLAFPQLYLTQQDALGSAVMLLICFVLAILLWG